MPRATFRFYSELNDHMPPERQRVPFEQELPDQATVRDMLKLLAVPESEVDLVLVNGDSVDLSHTVQEGDKVSIYPVFESFDISSVEKVHAQPLRQPRFILDVHLGKLAYHLRMLGFDTLYRNDYDDTELLSVSAKEKRALLTKDRKLLENPAVTRGYCVKGKDPREQLLEVMRRFDLFDSIHPFIRCLLCNTLLKPVSKEAVLGRLPEKVKELFSEFQLCPTCDRVYWKGSHYERMEEFIEGVVREGNR
jgi:uncharacterized protein with PIN domain/sulfur carrier protein ThiS